MSNTYTPTVLTIAGFDPYGGAGVQLDSKVIHQLGGYALGVATNMTAQNSQGVKETFTLPTPFFKTQLYTLLEDLHIDAVKIGILGNHEILEVILEAIETYRLRNIVLDTVLVSSSGYRLLEERAIALLKSALLPKVDLVTPNIPEVQALYNTQFNFSQNAREEAFHYFQRLGATNILFKGGHSENTQEAIDYLHTKAGDIITVSSPRVETTHTHGTGCFYSSAIATHLALGHHLEESVKTSKAFLYQKLAEAEALQFHYQERLKERKEPIL
jgi:hydroxymethylpyrimidine/phosphomethylpyrimidine kinase